jgi:hypothetical protein
MKSYCLLFAILIFVPSLYGEIKNGYGKEINDSIVSLRSLYVLLVNEKLSDQQKRLIRKRIRTIQNYLSCYELTDILLNKFKIVAPSVYNEIDSIKDSQGRSTDVYVKFVPRGQSRAHRGGTTFIAQAADDKNALLSEYGERTVSVEICISHNALFVLSHELGHIKYIVPNLARYIDFYRANYPGGILNCAALGHNAKDRSGWIAIIFERRFQKDHKNYLAKSGNRGGDSAILVMAGIRKKMKEEAKNPIRVTLSPLVY